MGHLCGSGHGSPVGFDVYFTYMFCQAPEKAQEYLSEISLCWAVSHVLGEISRD